MVQTIALQNTLVPDIAETCRAAINAHRAEAERLRRLPDPLVAALRDTRAFALLTPADRGGLELSLGATCEVYESIARIDGSVAWNVWNGNLGFSAALLPPAGADAIWDGTRDPIVANSARPSGVATPTADGFTLSGRWDIVSASEIADWIALFAIVPGDGAPDVQVLYVRREQVQVLDTWHTSGMRATGSHTVVADEVAVPAHLATSPFAPSRLDRPLYRIPAFTLASTGSAAIVVGMAQEALDVTRTIVRDKPLPGSTATTAERPDVIARLGAAQTALDAARTLLYARIGELDAAAEAGEPIELSARARLRAAMSHATICSRDALLAAHEVASSSAIYTDRPLEPLIRDGLVATQHGILARTSLDLDARMRLGLDPGTPVV